MLFPISGVELNPALPLFVGCAIGLLSGMFGIGGGFLATPVLMWMGVPARFAVASGLLRIVGASSSGAILKSRQGAFNLRLGLMVGLPGVIMAVVGVIIASTLMAKGSFDYVIKVLFSVLLVGIGIKMSLEMRTLWKQKKSGVPVEEETTEWQTSKGREIGAMVLGGIVGLMFGIMGGGGVVIVPFMIYALGVPAKMAMGTSLFPVLLMTSAGTIAHATKAQSVDVVLSGMMFAGGLVGVWAGAWISGRLHTKSLKGLFGIVVLASACKMIYGLVTGEVIKTAVVSGGGELSGWAVTLRDFALGYPFIFGSIVVILFAALGAGFSLVVSRPVRSSSIDKASPQT